MALVHAMYDDTRASLVVLATESKLPHMKKTARH